MGCFFSIFKFGTYVVKESEPNTQQVTVPEIRKHSSTPVATESSLHQLPKASAKLLLDKHQNKSPVEERDKDVNKEKIVYTTTFETQVDAAPPHPLEEKLQDGLDEIEFDTNIFSPDVEEAVVKIQAGVRGFLARKHINELRSSGDNTPLIDEDIPVVPPPKNFENQTLSDSFNDFNKWKKLSQHLEDKVSDLIEDQMPTEEQKIHPTINGRLTETVIPLKDSNDNKVIETYVCKENILDIEPTEEQPIVTHRTLSDETVVDRVFNVLMSETESESIINLVDTQKTKVESSVVEPIKESFNRIIASEDNTQESEVLAKLNEILDNNDTNIENISESDVKLKDDNNETSIKTSIETTIVTQEETIQTNIVEIVSQNTTQEIIRNSFHEFVKEMTDSVPKEEELTANEELIIESEDPVFESDERKTDSMIFEEEVVQTIFNEEMSKSQAKNQIFAIELFKDDVKEEQLANVTTLCEPEPNIKNIWGVEDKVCKTSVDKFVVKTVEPKNESQSPEDLNLVEIHDIIPDLETEQRIEVFSSQSRKNSEDLLESQNNTNEEPLVRPEEEILPIQSPIIQIEEQNGRILDEEEAAIRIQAAFRGYQIRRSLSREASPNRSLNHNHIDSNNNNHNNGFNDNEDNENAVQTIETNLLTNNELSVDSSEHFLRTNDENSDQLMTTSVEQIDSSLERLEDELMKELICSAEEEEKEEEFKGNSDLNQNLMDDLSSDELTAPLLLQRIQQSMSSDSSNIEEVMTQTVIQISEEPFEENRPLIEKSDTIITDLMSSPQTINNLIIDLNPKSIPNDVKQIEEQFNDSKVMDSEESNESPFIVSETVKEVTETPVEEINSSEAQVMEELIPNEEQKTELIIEENITEPEVIQIIETPMESTKILTETMKKDSNSQLLENPSLSEPEMQSQPIDSHLVENINIQSSESIIESPLTEDSVQVLDNKQLSLELESKTEPTIEELTTNQNIDSEPVLTLNIESEVLNKEINDSAKDIQSFEDSIPVSELNIESQSFESKEISESVPQTIESLVEELPILQTIESEPLLESKLEFEEKINELMTEFKSFENSVPVMTPTDSCEPTINIDSKPQSNDCSQITFSREESKTFEHSIEESPINQSIESVLSSQLDTQISENSQIIESKEQESVLKLESEPSIESSAQKLQEIQSRESEEEVEINREETELENSHSSVASNGVLDSQVSDLSVQNKSEETKFESMIEPPTPDIREITPELSFVRSAQEPVLTKICSSESEQESEFISKDKVVESRPSMIPVLESSKKLDSEVVFKKPKPILKEKESKMFTNVIPDEQSLSASEEISSPDDENPEFVGLGPNTPIPVRASSPNPFGKKRRRGKKGTAARK